MDKDNKKDDNWAIILFAFAIIGFILLANIK